MFEYSVFRSALAVAISFVEIAYIYIYKVDKTLVYEAVNTVRCDVERAA